MQLLLLAPVADDFFRCKKLQWARLATKKRYDLIYFRTIRIKIILGTTFPNKKKIFARKISRSVVDMFQRIQFSQWDLVKNGILEASSFFKYIFYKANYYILLFW